MRNPTERNEIPPRRSVARAPGRLDVMGGIGDYSGSLVLQLPLAVSTRAAVSLSDDSTYVVVSEVQGRDQPRREFSMPAAEGFEVLSSYESGHSYFSGRSADHWASYVLGCLTALRVEEGLSLPRGLSIQIASDVPEGKGVSSSAALEVSVMGALVALLRVDIPPERIAHLCQVVENRVAGAPCGIMDQMTAACGRKDHLLSLLCRPAELQGHIALPPGIAVWGIDSGIRHSVGGSDYRTVRTAASMGYRIIADREGLPVERAGDGHVRVNDDRFGGYLSAVGPTRLNEHRPHLPDRMRGSEFLEAFEGISDDTVSVDPDLTYPVRAATVHPILEHERNERFASMLKLDLTEKTLAMMGELMYLSHAGYAACGLGSPGTDRIVEMVKDSGYHNGLYGARITGGGSGGSVAVLASTDAADAVRRIAGQYTRESGLPVMVFEGSSNGLTVSRLLTKPQDEEEHEDD
ncbi:MAG TPA: hypothetical protein VMO47_13195 [Rhodothermales bacterium]|nr:hypothetical protein [Rhodothermales bacterium]